MKYIFFLLIFVFQNFNGFSKDPEILWWFDTNDSSFGQTAMDDIDNDGKYELVFGCYRNDSLIYALNSEDGTLLWKYNTTDYQEGCNDVAPLIYDVNDDGSKEVVVPSSCNPFTYCFDGKTGDVIWKTQTRGSDSPPTIADLDNDGNYEILHGEFGGYVISLNSSNGNMIKDIKVDTNSWIQTAPTILDINNDNQLDIIVSTWNFNDNNKIYAYSGADYSLLWQTQLDDYVYHGSAVVDLNFDGTDEIIFGDYSGKLYVLNSSDGTIMWSYLTGGYVGSPVTVADINADGAYELVFCSGSKIIAMNSEGQLLWEYLIPEFGTSFRGVVISDITGDEYPDVIFGTSKGDLIVLNSISGLPLEIIDLEEHLGKPFDINHAPVVGDFNQNGLMDVFIVGGHTEYPEFGNNYGRGYAVEFDSGNGPDWKMFQNNIHRTCTIEIINSSVHTELESQLISIYPNPTNSGNHFTIRTEGLFKKVDIYSIIGQKIYSQKFEKEMIIDYYFNQGLYYIQFISENKVIQKSFIIQ